jgi:hypothetical protein
VNRADALVGQIDRALSVLATYPDDADEAADARAALSDLARLVEELAGALEQTRVGGSFLGTSQFQETARKALAKLEELGGVA